MNNRDNPDMELQNRVILLFKLWDDIRLLFRLLPKPEQVGPINRTWITHPPVKHIVPRLITHAAMQPIDPKQRVLVMHGLIAWSEAYSQLVAIAALKRDQRPAVMYSEATGSLYRCADDLARAAVAIRRSQSGRHRRYGRRSGD